MNKSRWQIKLGDEAEKDFVRILTYTKENFGQKQGEIYRVTLLDAIAALGEGPNVPGSSARDDLPANIRTLHVARRGRRGRHFIMLRSAQGL